MSDCVCVVLCVLVFPVCCVRVCVCVVGGWVSMCVLFRGKMCVCVCHLLLYVGPHLEVRAFLFCGAPTFLGGGSCTPTGA